MFEIISERPLIEWALARRNEVIQDDTRLASSWVTETDSYVIAAENLTNVDEVELEPLSRAFSRYYPGKLFAITTDFDDDELIVARFDAAPVDFDRLEWEFFGRHLVMFDQTVKSAILCNPVGDYKLIAGPVQFLKEYAGNLSDHYELFLEFVDMMLDSFGDHEGYRRNLEKAARCMSWIKDLEEED